MLKNFRDSGLLFVLMFVVVVWNTTNDESLYSGDIKKLLLASCIDTSCNSQVNAKFDNCFEQSYSPRKRTENPSLDSKKLVTCINEDNKKMFWGSNVISKISAEEIPCFMCF
jgi:hypothetical protein